MMGGKPQVKYKVLQDAKERRGLGSPHVKLYFAALDERMGDNIE